MLSSLRRQATAALLASLVASCSSNSNPDPSLCDVCMQEKCSALISTCDLETNCRCMRECTAEHGIPGIETCLSSCGVTTRPAGFAQVEECTAVACPDAEDECATPSNWTPPSNGLACDGLGTGNLSDGSLADCGFDRQLPYDAKGTVLQLESEDGRICARLERRDVGAGTLANTTWEPLSVRVGVMGAVSEVSAGDGLCWYSSHHNFRDWVHVYTGTRHYDLALKVDIGGGATTYELFAYEGGPLEAGQCAPDADGSMCIQGPITLRPVVP